MLKVLLPIEAVLTSILLIGSSYLSGLIYWRLARRVTAMFGACRSVAFLCWLCFSGLFVGPSILTFGYVGAGLASYSRTFGLLAMAVTVPVATATGAAVAGLLVTLLIFSAFAVLKTIFRKTNCPIFGRRATAS